MDNNNIRYAFELSNDLLQNIILRNTTSNISQRKSRKQLIAEHERLDPYINKNKKFLRNNFGSTLDLQLESRISLMDLQVDDVPTGRFLLCRVITKSIKLHAI